MCRKITFQEPGFNRVYFIDLLDETEDIKWKILEWHNQDFLRGKLDKEKYSIESHKNFLENLLYSKRKHYIAYFDGRPVGKYDFIADGQMILDSGSYLFFEKDLMSGIGLLTRHAFLKYVFENLKLNKIAYKVYKTNRSVISLSKKMGGVIVAEDNDCIFFEITIDSWLEKKEKIDKLVKFMFM